MRFLAFLLLTTSTTCPLGCVVTADVGGLEAPADAGPADGAPSPDPAEASPPPLDGGADALPLVDHGCGVTFAQEGAFVDVQVVVGPSPFLRGGTLVPGTYALVSRRDFYPNRQGTMQLRETMVVRGSASAGAFDVLTEARNATGSFKAYALHGETITYDTGGGTPAMFTTEECPQKDFQRTGTFEAGGDTLVLWDDSEQIERTYHRMR